MPDVIHINGWMASLIPIYLKTFYKNDYYFNNTKLVFSVYNEEDMALSPTVKAVLDFDQISEVALSDSPSTRQFLAQSMAYADAVVKGDEFLEEVLDEQYKSSASEKADFVEPENIGKVY